MLFPISANNFPISGMLRLQAVFSFARLGQQVVFLARVSKKNFWSSFLCAFLLVSYIFQRYVGDISSNMTRDKRHLGINTFIHVMLTNTTITPNIPCWRVASSWCAPQVFNPGSWPQGPQLWAVHKFPRSQTQLQMFRYFYKKLQPFALSCLYKCSVGSCPNTLNFWVTHLTYLLGIIWPRTQIGAILAILWPSEDFGWFYINSSTSELYTQVNPTTCLGDTGSTVVGSNESLHQLW